MGKWVEKQKQFWYVYGYNIAYDTHEIFNNDFMWPWKEQRIVRGQAMESNWGLNSSSVT